MGSRQINIGGVTPFSATDYPGKFATVVFVQGCPWRCGYCHNPHLQERTRTAQVPWDDVLALLTRRAGLIDAVVFSGGEPTTDPGLVRAIAQVKAMGFGAGLHTACVYPRRLELALPLLDWVGFDIKAPFAQYERITGVAGSGEHARECAAMIVDSGVPYECRTTIHPSLLAPHEILSLAMMLSALGVRNYALQQFRAQGCTDAVLGAAALDGYPGQRTLDAVGSLFEQFTYRRPG